MLKSILSTIVVSLCALIPDTVMNAYYSTLVQGSCSHSLLSKAVRLRRCIFFIIVCRNDKKRKVKEYKISLLISVHLEIIYKITLWYVCRMFTCFNLMSIEYYATISILQPDLKVVTNTKGIVNLKWKLKVAIKGLFEYSS